VPIFQERLLDLGKWLSNNSEAIYESSPWTTQNDTLIYGVWYTTNDPSVYAIVLNWPDDNVVNLGSVVSLFANADTEVTLLGNEEQLSVIELLIFFTNLTWLVFLVASER
jgi:alpha-L-fucosidase